MRGVSSRSPGSHSASASDLACCVVGFLPQLWTQSSSRGGEVELEILEEGFRELKDLLVESSSVILESASHHSVRPQCVLVYFFFLLTGRSRLFQKGGAAWPVGAEVGRRWTWGGRLGSVRDPVRTRGRFRVA